MKYLLIVFCVSVTVLFSQSLQKKVWANNSGVYYHFKKCSLVNKSSFQVRLDTALMILHLEPDNCIPEKSDERMYYDVMMRMKRTIDKTEFDELEIGMPLREVTSIIGYEGEIISESVIGEIHTEMRSYDGFKESYSNAKLMFQNGKLISKSQYGLK